MNVPALSNRRGHRSRIVVLGACLVLSTSACIGKLGRTRDPFGGEAVRGQTPIRVEVQNLNFNDGTVFAMRGGQQIRLGDVTGKTDKTFTLQWDFALPLQFFIDIVGTRSCQTNQLGVDPGSKVWVQIPANIGMTPCRASRR